MSVAKVRVDVVEGRRHFSNVEAPDAFNALLRSGLDGFAGAGEETA